MKLQSTQDKTIQCRECGNEFRFSIAEQQRFADLDFTDPVRCYPCREARKRARRAQEGPYNE